MLIPRFSIRSYFIATVLLALFSVVLGCAIDGQHWAHGVVAAILGSAAAFGMYAAFFAIGWMFAERHLSKNAPRPQSPFAGTEPPKQIMPPVEM